MTDYKGGLVEGSADLQTSVAGIEILSEAYVDFEMINDANCHVKINDGDYIFIRASQGISINYIKSLKIEEGAITFNWIGTRA